MYLLTPRSTVLKFVETEKNGKGSGAHENRGSGGGNHKKRRPGNTE